MAFKTAFVYSTDENYVKLTAVSIHSLLKHNPGAAIVILTNGVSNTSADFLRTLVTDRGGSLELIDVAERLSHIKELGACGYVSFSAYSRLFIPILLADRFDRAAYIDGDTLVVDSLLGLSSLDLQGKPLAIGYDCLHNSYKKLIGLDPNASYFNSGVLAMDLSEWTRQRCTERILDYMKDVRHDLMFGDQDYFSLVLANDTAILPPRYNFLTHFQLFRRARDARFAMDIPSSCWYNEKEFAAAQAKPAIHHFLGNTLGRPWFKESKNPLRPLYVRTAAEAGLPEVASQSRPIDFCYRVQWFSWKILPRPLFVRACRAMYRYFFKSRYGI